MKIPTKIYQQNLDCSEAATRDVLYKKVLLEISQNSQENTYARDFSTLRVFL